MSAAAERDEPLFFLNRLRDAVVRTSDVPVDDRRPGVPSGTNLLGLVWHLTAMEKRWFRHLFLGGPPEGDGSMRVPDALTREDVVAASTSSANSPTVRPTCSRRDGAAGFPAAPRWDVRDDAAAGDGPCR